MLKSALRLLCKIALENNLAVRVDEVTYWVDENFDFFKKGQYSWENPTEVWSSISEEKTLEENSEIFAAYLENQNGTQIEFTNKLIKKIITKAVWE